MIVIGDPAVGKSTYTLRVVDKGAGSQAEAFTAGADSYCHSVTLENGTKVDFQLWDTGIAQFSFETFLFIFAFFKTEEKTEKKRKTQKEGRNQRNQKRSKKEKRKRRENNEKTEKKETEKLSKNERIEPKTKK